VALWSFSTDFLLASLVYLKYVAIEKNNIPLLKDFIFPKKWFINSYINTKGHN